MLLMKCIFLFIFSNFVASHSVIETLPGFNGKLPFNLETGYVGVGYKEEVQLFYYFIESERSPEDDPLVLWLVGGPGCSALNAIVYINGPLVFNYAAYSERRPTFLLNPYSLTKIANVIYLDSPVGAGFSYATTREGYKTGDLSSVTRSYEFLQKWLMARPKFLSNPLYIGGESYSGIPVPILVQEISNGIDRGDEPFMNLKGFMLGNPATETLKYDSNARIEVARRFALIPEELYKSTKENCKGSYIYPDPSNLLCVSNGQALNESLKKLFDENFMEPKCSTWHLSSLLGENPIDVLSTPQKLGDWCQNYHYLYSDMWANDKTVQKALHVREGTVTEWIRCNRSMLYTFDAGFSSLNYQRNITRRAYRVLIYRTHYLVEDPDKNDSAFSKLTWLSSFCSGEHDSVFPLEGTHAWIQSLNLAISKDWQPWFVDGHVAGKVITYSRKKYKYSLTFASIKGGSHVASETKPRECFAVLDRWFSDSPL